MSNCIYIPNTEELVEELGYHHIPPETPPEGEFDKSVFITATSFKKGHKPKPLSKEALSRISESKKRYWKWWHEHNEVKPQVYIKKGYDIEARSKRMSERNTGKTGGLNNNAKPVKAEGIVFGSVKECAEHFKCSVVTVRNRIRSDKFDYGYIKS